MNSENLNSPPKDDKHIASELTGMFRGYNPKTREWHVGCLLRNQNSISHIYLPKDGTFHHVDDKTVGMITPLFDKNASPIFQRDVVRDTVTDEEFEVIFTDHGNFGLKVIKTKSLQTVAEKHFQIILPSYASSTLEILRHVWYYSMPPFIYRHRSYHDLREVEKQCIVAMSNDGMQSVEIAMRFGVNRVTVVEVIKELTNI